MTDTNTKLRLALVGTDSLRGREIKEILSSQAFPIESMEFFDPGVKEKYSKLTQFRDEPKVITSPDAASLKGIDLVFLAADKKSNRRYAKLASEQGALAYDLGESFTEASGVPVVVSGINDREVLRRPPPIVANPHPVAIFLSHMFFVINRKSALHRAAVVVLQPASVYDDPGIEELANQSVDMLQSSGIEKRVFKAQVAFNLLSQTEPTDPYGFSVAEKRIGREVRAVLSEPELPISVSMVQAPVFHGYSLMVYLELEKPLEMDEIESLFRQSSYFTFSRPSLSCPVSSIAAAGRGEIFIGQLKKDAFLPRTYWLWAVADNLTRGSAVNAFEAAQTFVSLR